MRVSPYYFFVLVIGCGGTTTPAPFVLRVQSTDVTLSAVSELEIEIDPAELRMFYPIDADLMEMHEEDGIETQISTSGEFVMTVDANWLEAHEVDTTAGPFAVEVPLWTDLREDVESIPDQEEISDPELTVRARRNGMLISDDDFSSSFLPWPLVSGEERLVNLKCIEDGGANIPQCDNLDP